MRYLNLSGRSTVAVFITEGLSAILQPLWRRGAVKRLGRSHLQEVKPSIHTQQQMCNSQSTVTDTAFKNHKACNYVGGPFLKQGRLMRVYINVSFMFRCRHSNNCKKKVLVRIVTRVLY